MYYLRGFWGKNTLKWMLFLPEKIHFLFSSGDIPLVCYRETVQKLLCFHPFLSCKLDFL